MSSRLWAITTQAVCLSAVSNTIAQGFTAYREGSLSAVDPVAFAHFLLLAVITAPPNYQWQLALERNFPTNVKGARKATKEKEGEAGDSFSITNTVIKFLLDQTFGAAFNTILFIVVINLLRGAGWIHIVTTVQNDFFPMIMAGYKFWPMVTLLNLIVVPVEQRMLVGGLAGLVWGVYLSLLEL